MKSLILWVVMLLLLAACASLSVPTETVMPTVSPMVSPTLTSAPTITPGPSIKCQEVYPIDYVGQVGFRGIFPGKTTKEELPETLDEYHLQETYDGDLAYEDDKGVPFIFIRVSLNKVISILSRRMEFGTLEEILLDLGCPDMIFRRYATLDVEPYIVERGLRLAYNNNGIYFYFETSTIGPKSEPVDITYFSP